MKKILLQAFVFTFALSHSQVGINQLSPSASLDIVSKGNTNTTKALEINNSTGTEMMTVLDNGNVGINAPVPTAKLHTKGSIRYENLPQLASSVTPIAVDANGYVGTYVPAVLYSYITIDNSQTTSAFSLYNNSIFYSLPFQATGIASNSLNVTLGTDASATLNRTSGGSNPATNVIYITIPDPGVYKLNLKYSINCTGSISGSNGGNNFIGAVSSIYLASTGSTAYNEQTSIRTNIFPLRDSTGNLSSPGQYDYPSQNSMFSIIATTTANQKLALFTNWGTGDQFNTNVCSLSGAAGLEKKATLIISKL